MHGNVIKVVGLFVAMVFGMTGCGGSGEGSKASTLTVSGTASEGALITGKTVRLKDANGTAAVDTTTDTTTGSYSIDVTNLTAPFLVTVTGTNGTYVSLAPAAGIANINPITTTVVSLAAATPNVSALFSSLTPAQLAAINTNFTAKSALVSSSLQAALPTGVKADDYFTGTITAGIGKDAVFDTYKITIHPTDGITIKTKDATAATVLSIPANTIYSNANAPLPAISVLPNPINTDIPIPAITITTGVRGNVWYWEGDFMPFVYTDIPPSTVPSSRGKISPVVREIQIHRVTTVTDMNSYGPLFSDIPTELVATTTSDQTGFYQIDLPPGIYSAFIKEGTKYYANGFDSQGIMAFEVRSGTVTEMRLDITLAATF